MDAPSRPDGLVAGLSCIQSGVVVAPAFEPGIKTTHRAHTMARDSATVTWCSFSLRNAMLIRTPPHSPFLTDEKQSLVDEELSASVSESFQTIGSMTQIS